MTAEAIKRQIEILEKVSRETSESPEAGRAFLREIELRTGIKLRDKKKPLAQKKK